MMQSLGKNQMLKHITSHQSVMKHHKHFQKLNPSKLREDHSNYMIQAKLFYKIQKISDKLINKTIFHNLN